MISFKEFLRLLDEDAASDVAKLQADITTLDSQMLQRSRPLQMQKERLQKLLAIKAKQQNAEEKKNQMKQDPQLDQKKAAQQAPAPGQTTAGTPGVAPAIR